MAYTFFLVYLTRHRLLVVAEYAGELGFWSTESFCISIDLEVRANVPSGPRRFDADGGGFRDDFFRLPMRGSDTESGRV